MNEWASDDCQLAFFANISCHCDYWLPVLFPFHLLEHEAHAASTDTTSITTFRPSKKRGRGERERGGERGGRGREGREWEKGRKERGEWRKTEGGGEKRETGRKGGREWKGVSNRLLLLGYVWTDSLIPGIDELHQTIESFLRLAHSSLSFSLMKVIYCTRA